MFEEGEGHREVAVFAAGGGQPVRNALRALKFGNVVQ